MSTCPTCGTFGHLSGTEGEWVPDHSGRIAELEAEVDGLREMLSIADSCGSYDHSRARKAEARVNALEEALRNIASNKAVRLESSDYTQHRLHDIQTGLSIAADMARQALEPQSQSLGDA